MEKIILVHYIDVGNMPASEVHEHMLKIQKMLYREEQDTVNYIVPIQGQTRIECLNPKLVSEEEYAKAKEMLDRNQKIVDELVLMCKQRDDEVEKQTPVENKGPKHSEK